MIGSRFALRSLTSLALLGSSALPLGVSAGLTPTRAEAALTYYVRPDGGSPSQCTGRVDAPYPGSGSAQPCAWDHPFRALPPGGTPRIAGGDALVIGSGSYMMGYGAAGADNCAPESAWECTMPPIPSGPSPASRTRILGVGLPVLGATGTGGTAAVGEQPGTESGGVLSLPELWGTERTEFILNLTGASNVEIGWLEITDHSSCVEFHTGGLACRRDTYPFGRWAVRGIYAQDSANVYLHDLNIHGLATAGIHAARLTDWTVDNVRIAANGWVGWDGDIDGPDSNAGTMLFRRWTVEWNGCGESWPGGQPTGCWAQEAGGYGDGVGTGVTGGRWIIEDSAFLYNTSDGLDLLYARIPGSSIEIRRTIARGNAGNQIKTAGPTLIENSLVVGNCGFFTGQPFTFNVDNCRAAGNTLSLDLRPANRVSVTNSTLSGEGDCLVLAACDGTCTGSESVRLRNNIFYGQTDFLQPFERTCLVYQETFPQGDAVFDVDYSVITNVKDNPCPGPHAICGVAPRLVDTGADTFDGHLLPGSPAIDAGTALGAPATDLEGHPRPGGAGYDIGAYEFGGVAPPVPGTPPGSSTDLAPAGVTGAAAPGLRPPGASRPNAR